MSPEAVAAAVARLRAIGGCYLVVAAAVEADHAVPPERGTVARATGSGRLGP